MYNKLVKCQLWNFEFGNWNQKHPPPPHNGSICFCSVGNLYIVCCIINISKKESKKQCASKPVIPTLERKGLGGGGRTGLD